MPTIRPAELKDLDAIVDIYNHYVTTTHFTFDVETFTTETRRPWFDQFDGARYRCLVLVGGGGVSGYACSAPFKPKAAYATSVEVSIYLAPGATGRGAATPLYAALYSTLANEDVHRAYALIALPNDASVAFHHRFRFEEVARLHEVGRKFDRYWDVAYFEKRLNEPKA